MPTTKKSFAPLALLPLVAAALLIPSVPAGAATGSVVDYAASDEIIANPERGINDTINTHYREDGSDYVSLVASELRAARAEGVTQLVRVFYMEKFVDQPRLDAEWLALLNADFATARAAGVSVIPRFAYVQGGDYPYSAPYGDAPLPIVLEHIAQLGPVLSSNADVIATVQAGFIGLWGEWYYTDNFVADPTDPGVVTDADWDKRRTVVEALLDALPADRTIQLRTMQMKQVIQDVPTGAGGGLTSDQAFDGSDLSRTGHHNDCFLASPDDFGTFLSDPISLDQDYLATDTRFVPMGGETCTVNPPRSEFASASAEMARYHYSYLNRDYNTDVLDSWGAAGIVETAKRLGYRFVMEQSRIDGSAIELDVRNDGWAAPYNPRPAELVLTGDAGTFRLPFGTDARTWAAGTSTTIAADACSLPAGSYSASLALPSAEATVARNPDYSIQTANIGTWNATTGENSLGQTLVSTGSCSGAAAAVAAAELAATGTASAAPWSLLALGSVVAGVAVLLMRARRRAVR